VAFNAAQETDLRHEMKTQEEISPASKLLQPPFNPQSRHFQFGLCTPYSINKLARPVCDIAFAFLVLLNFMLRFAS